MPLIHPLSQPDDDPISSIQYAFYDQVLDPDWVKEQLNRIVTEYGSRVSQEDIEDLAEWLHEMMMNGLVRALHEDTYEDGHDPDICDACQRFGQIESEVTAQGNYGEG